MLIEVLGSSAGWPIPRLGCDCPQCTSPDPRDRRLRSSLLLDRRVLVDAGPDAYAQLIRAGAVPEQIVLTHDHHDQCSACTRSPSSAGSRCIAPRSARRRRMIFPRLDFRVMHLTPGVPAELGNGLRVQAFDVDHSSNAPHDGPALHRRGGRTLAYMPDLAEPPGSKLARGADVALLDGSSRDRPVRGHVPMSEMVTAAPQAQGRAGALHPHRPPHGHTRRARGGAAGGFGIAHDGLAIEL